MPCRHPRQQCDPIFANFQELSFTLTKFGVALGDFLLLLFLAPSAGGKKIDYGSGYKPSKK
jgi:hypothetical protein